jgi:hypothetical protein
MVRFRHVQEELMRQNLIAAMLVAACSLFASAQSTQAPALTLKQHVETLRTPIESAGVPSLCSPCVFYGGDFNMFDPNAQSFANVNSLLVPDTTTYAAVDVPGTVHGAITGIIFSQLAPGGNGVFDPSTATYDIRTGVSSGNGGTSVASGNVPMSYQLSGRCECEEYETAVTLAKPFTVTSGTRYWVNLLTQCTDSGNPDCDGEVFFANTTQETNGLNAGAQPVGQMFFNSAFFGYSWTNWCDPSLGQNAQECARASFSLIGHK